MPLSHTLNSIFVHISAALSGSELTLAAQAAQRRRAAALQHSQLRLMRAAFLALRQQVCRVKLPPRLVVVAPCLTVRHFFLFSTSIA
jgi:hypothetical protein